MKKLIDLIWYPGEKPRVKGIFADEILKEIRRNAV